MWLQAALPRAGDPPSWDPRDGNFDRPRPVQAPKHRGRNTQVARVRRNATVVGFAASALVAASLWSVPPLAAVEVPPADPTTTETSEPPT